jgi:hypothetical protein
MLLFLASIVLADEIARNSCCAAVGASGTCANELSIYGEGSSAAAGSAGLLVTGAWRMSCGQPARFDANYRTTVEREPRKGDVLSAPSPLSAHCFAQACEMPVGTCLHANPDGNVAVLGCSDGMPASTEVLTKSAPRKFNRAVVVVVEGRPLVVEAQPSGGEAPPVTSPSAGASPAAVAASAMASALAELTASFPEDPPEACKPKSESLRAEARRHVDLGDERRIARDTLGALTKYRVSLTMDVCNGYAWVGIGEVAYSGQRPDLAAHAQRNATGLLPRNYHAFVSLGQSYEALGQSGLAAEAYRSALDISPSLQEARLGLARTSGAPR